MTELIRTDETWHMDSALPRQCFGQVKRVKVGECRRHVGMRMEAL